MYVAGAHLRTVLLFWLCPQNLCVVCVATYAVNAALLKLSLADYKAVVASLRAGLCVGYLSLYPSRFTTSAAAHWYASWQDVLHVDGCCLPV